MSLTHILMHTLSIIRFATDRKAPHSLTGARVLLAGESKL